MASEQKFGLCWRERLVCKGCGFLSKIHNLYEDLPQMSRGRRPANINHSLHVGLSQTSIGPSSFSKILCSINTPPPSASGMQKSANKILETVTRANKYDMRLRCEDLRSINNLQGKKTSAINVQADGCYNNALYSGVGKTPLQPQY